MARAAGGQVEKNFSRGRISEVNALGFPENACIDESNCVFDITGKVTRRLGMDYEDNFQDYTTFTAVGANATFIWKNAAPDSAVNLIAIQTGDKIGFFEIGFEGNLSGQQKAFGINLETYKTYPDGDISKKVCQFTTGNGYLFISHPYCHPLYVKYNPGVPDSITVTRIVIEIRDLEGLDDGLDPEVRPAGMTREHEYNLMNQGWWERLVSTRNGGQQYPLQHWFNFQTLSPSNADIWWLFKDTDDDFNAKPKVVGDVDLGNSLAPKGHFIGNAFFFDRGATSGVPGISNTTNLNSRGMRPSTIAFFAGRVWYAGVKHPEFQRNVYYSQIVESDKQIGKCYQTNDPTAEHQSDLLDTDGGVVRILDLGDVVCFFVMKEQLLIFANNGIWAISGSTGTGFKATDYSVTRISSIGALSKTSLVDAEGIPFWWNLDGIYTIRFDPASGSVEVTSLTKTTIQTFYNEDIKQENKRYAMGAYNPVTKVLAWVYRSETFIQEDDGVFSVNIEDAYRYDRVILLDLYAQAFYTWSIGSAFTRMRGIFTIDSVGTTINSEDVWDENIVTVTNNALDDVFVNIVITADLPARFKFLVDGAVSGISFAEPNNTDYRDFADADPLLEGEDFTSYVITGYKVHAEGNKDFNTNWITVFTDGNFDPDEPFSSTTHSLLVQGRWDFSRSGGSGKWTTQQQCYPYTTTRVSRQINRKKLKLRGKGPALQLHFTSMPSQPFQLVGWSTFETAEQGV